MIGEMEETTSKEIILNHQCMRMADVPAVLAYLEEYYATPMGHKEYEEFVIANAHAHAISTDVVQQHIKTVLDNR